MDRMLGGAVSVTDLSASPKIDRDHPPDLKQLADGAAVVEALKATAAPASASATPSAAKLPNMSAAKAGSKATTAAAATGGLPAALDVARIVDRVISRVSLLQLKSCHLRYVVQFLSTSAF